MLSNSCDKGVYATKGKASRSVGAETESSMGSQKTRRASFLAKGVRYVVEQMERRVMLNAVTFDLPPEYATASNPQCVISGDFNGDGKADLATANGNGTISVLLNNGNG